MKHTMDMDRLAALAADFGNPASRRQMMQEFGDYPNALSGANENGEQTLISICPNSLIVKTFQENGWVRVNEYGADGQMRSTTPGTMRCTSPSRPLWSRSLTRPVTKLPAADSASNPRPRGRGTPSLYIIKGEIRL